MGWSPKTDEALASANRKLAQTQSKLADVREALDTTMHEVRRLTTELSSQSANLLKELNGHRAETQAATVMHTAEMVTARLAYTDLQLNPGAVSLQTRVPAGLYKKFEKARYVLGQSAKAKRIEIRFTGNSFATLPALQAFELIPFIVLDNAVKYSQPQGEVEVIFRETLKDVEIEVRSMGPRLDGNEKERLFKQHFRGKHAASLAVYGAGLGLYVARTIADLHNGLSITADSEELSSFTLNGIPYSAFVVKVVFCR